MRPSPFKIPLLNTRLKRIHSIRTIAPLGEWVDCFLFLFLFSEEIYNALNYGYKFNIQKGFCFFVLFLFFLFFFESANIFKEYVDSLYELKYNSSKDSLDYIISKLLLKTLYGRFGMNPQMENHVILSNKESLKLQNHKVLTNILDLNMVKNSFLSLIIMIGLQKKKNKNLLTSQ
jgi:hypothetical protein